MSSECPYCREFIHGDIINDLGGGTHTLICKSCAKTFRMQIRNMEPDIYTFKADCLNGGEHIWKSMCSTVRLKMKKWRRNNEK